MAVIINYDLCKPNCYECQEICPHNVFWPNEEATDEKAHKPEVRYPEDCHHCYMLWNCARVCPVDGAIEIIPKIAYKVWFPV